MNGNRSLVVLAFLVVFISGGVIGTLFALHYGVPKSVLQPIRPEQFGPQLMRRFLQTSELGLTPSQKQRIRLIGNDTAEDLRRVQRENNHNTILILEHWQDEVAALLTPGQRVRFDEIAQQQREKFQKYQEEQAARQKRIREAEPAQPQGGQPAQP